MIITIQQVNDRTVIRFGSLEITTNVLSLATTIASGLADAHWEKTGERIVVKLLPIKHTPMAMKSRTYPAKKQAVAKKGKVVKKAVKK